MSTYLVTGAAGFIGSHLCERLLKNKHTVIGIDNFDPFYDKKIKEKNLSLLQSNQFHFQELDITDESALNVLLAEKKPEIIIHLAAKAGVRPSIENPFDYAHNNVTGTTTILQAGHRYNVKKIIIASSSSVYGNHPTVPFAETHDVNAPISPYAATKRACELVASTFHHLYQTPIACLRFFTVYGPRQRPDLAIQKFLTKLKNNEPIELFGDGSTSRDYTFINDIIDGILASVSAINQYGFRIWNLGGHSPVSLKQLIETIEQVTGKQFQIKHLPTQPGDVERTYADLTRSQAELNFHPKTNLAEGIKQQWDSILSF